MIARDWSENINHTGLPQNSVQIHTFPTKADLPPSRAMPTATFAGAPPGAFLKAGASARDTPATVGTKSISISPKHIISGAFVGVAPFCSATDALIVPVT